MKNKFFEFYLIIFLMLIFIVYSILSVLYKNPNYYLKNRGIIEGYYIIEETKNRTRKMGSLTGRDSWIEPSSYESLTLRKKNSNILVLVECSITELGCPFSNETNLEVYVKYVESNFFSRKFAFYIKSSEITYDEKYFNEKYKKENYMKLIFIIFYFGGCFYYMYISIREKNFF
ncbi:hypothetical protein [Acinetobacter sp. YH12128]|uniref:hypothetical protein n=1 Tax=Acinetobacter sp. YH12128 TaxID=2601113 RepID=UPI0015D2F866|nr:hypothetical protein [Acinetobacter sp. YH12128]